MNYYTKTTGNWAETIGAPPGDVLRLLILQKRDEAIQELRNYQYNTARGIQARIHKVKARMMFLYLELYSSLKRSMKADDFKELSKKIRSNDIELLSQAFFTMSDFLDDKKITRFDTRPNIDFTNPEAENRYYGV